MRTTLMPAKSFVVLLCFLCCRAGSFATAEVTTEPTAAATTAPITETVIGPTITAPKSAVYERGVIASVNPLATDAGVQAFRRGGNAIDAAVAAALTLGVVDGHNSGLGGGCLMLVRRAGGEFAAIDGRETAPAAATRRMFIRNDEAQSQLSVVGPLAVAVPGALAAYELAIEQHGQLQLSELLEPAADIAQSGFAIDRPYAERLQEHLVDLRRFPGTRAALLNDGRPWSEGDILKQPDLARLYRNIARHGTRWFYRGPFAEALGRWMAENGGILTAQDLATYRPKLRTPVVSTYRDHTIVGFPPPSSGGTHVAQILNILENFDLRSIHGERPAEAYHIVAEAMKLAFADRAYWLGDADFVDVPRGLADAAYAADLAKKIDTSRVTAVRARSVPPRWRTDLFGKHTTHIAAADAEGNWVALTATVNTSFGSMVIVPGTGLILNNEMDDFSIQPGVPNAFGLVGAENNAIAPGKRPLSSMSPTIVLKDGEPTFALGAAGGPKIITEVVWSIVNHLDFGKNMAESLAVGRIHHQWLPDSLRVEPHVPDAILRQLESRGHRLEVNPEAGVTQVVGLDGDGMLFGVHDPRVPGKAGGL